MKLSMTRKMLALAAVAAIATPLAWDYSSPNTELSVGHGDVATLTSAFDGWRRAYETRGGSPEILKLSLGYSKALSHRFTRGRGQMELNLLDGELAFKAVSLEDGAYDLWFVDHGSEPGNTVQLDPNDKLMRLGGIKVEKGQGELAVRLTREQLAGFTMDAVVLSEAAKTPVDSVVLTGSPDLMQKLYYTDQLWTVADLGSLPKDADSAVERLDFVLPKPAFADGESRGRDDLSRVLGTQVALGRQLFHKEKFGGNGRTCGTCHREDNNFTIDPNYIATLPDSDPLFVDVPGLENPTLLRNLGLVLTNVDGFDKAPIMRSVPHTLSLATSVISENTHASPPYKNGEFEADNVFQGATGWAGDGAPGAGSLAEFTVGAVTQHFPRTIDRCPKNVNTTARPECANKPADFVLPTQAQIDAIEAYMLSLGRSKDYPVWKLTFNDPLVEEGRKLIDTKENPCKDGTAQSGGPSPAPKCSGQTVSNENVKLGSSANCNGCHMHSGARSSTTFANPTRNTGVENLKLNPARLIETDLAYDGGFGIGGTFCGPDDVNSANCFGDQRFNTPPLIEAADTAPFFHNNSVSTVEEAVAAYNSDAFNNSPGAVTSKQHNRTVKLDSSQVTAIALYLRSINAMENIRLSNRLDEQARQAGNGSSAQELVKVGNAETEDALTVLKGGKLLGSYAAVIAKLEAASRLEKMAIYAGPMRSGLLQQAIQKKQEAKALIASCDDARLPPTSVPSLVVWGPGGSDPAAPTFNLELNNQFVYSCGELDAISTTPPTDPL